MKHLIAPLLLLSISITASAQVFYVRPTEKHWEAKVVEKMQYDGYKMTYDSTKADYKIECFVKQLMPLGGIMGPSYKGYLEVTNLHTGEVVGKTKEIERSPAALNGYNAANNIFRVISKRYLPDLLSKCKPYAQPD